MDPKRCSDCGFDPNLRPDDGLVIGLSDQALGWGRLLATTPVVALRTRPANGVWAGIEYAAHVRDVLGVFARRIERIRTELNPKLDSWDQEAAIRDSRSIDEDPVLMAEAISGGARNVQEALVGCELDWDRVAQWSSGESLTLRGTVRLVLHEMQHHRLDVENGVNQIDWPVQRGHGET